MNSHRCCQESLLTSDGRNPRKSPLARLRGATGWVVPGTLLAILPKCPICLAAYVAMGTGITLSGSSAKILMRVLTVVCIGTLTLLVARCVVSYSRSRKQTDSQLVPTIQ